MKMHCLLKIIVALGNLSIATQAATAQDIFEIGMVMPTASDLSGFIASALVLMTFAMKDMRLLRITAIFSNVAFISYSSINVLFPVLVLHLLLLPINALYLLRTSSPEVANGKHPLPIQSATEATSTVQ